MSDHHWFWLTDLWGQRKKYTEQDIQTLIDQDIMHLTSVQKLEYPDIVDTEESFQLPKGTYEVQTTIQLPKRITVKFGCQPVDNNDENIDGK